MKNVSCLALLLLFAFCQIVGVMCSMPDVSLADEAVCLSIDMTGCPMDGAFMCPPSLTSSSEWQGKHGWSPAGEQPIVTDAFLVPADVRPVRALVGSDPSPPAISLLALSITVLRI